MGGGKATDKKHESDDSGLGMDTPSATIPPDGGWGWVIMAASFMISVLVDGVCFTFGIFFTEFLEYFGESKGKTVLLGSVLNGAYLSLGPVAGALVNKFGCRVVAILGAILAAFGFFMCTFSPNLDVMIFLYAAVGGSGFGLMYLPAIVMVGYYFEKKRALATGIAVCGSGIGNFVFAPLCEFLLKSYSWQGAMWIISGMVLNGIVFSTFFRPLSETSGKKKNDNSSSKLENDINVVVFEENGKEKKSFLPGDFETSLKNPIYRCKSMELRNGNSSDGNVWVGRLAHSQDISALQCEKKKTHVKKNTTTINPLSRKDIFYSGSLHNLAEHKNSKNEVEFIAKMTISHEEIDTESSDQSRCHQCKTSFSELFDFSLFLSPTFVLYGTSCFLCMFGFFIPFNFLPDFAKDLNIGSKEAAFLISIIGISNTVTRILVGLITDQPWADALLINYISLILGGVTTFLVPFYTGYALLAAYAVVFGACIATFVSLRSIIMVELMGIEKLTSAFGLVVLCQGLSSFIGSPIAGSLSDVTGDYAISFYLAGATIGVAGLICIPLRRVVTWENKRKDKKKAGNEEFVIENPEAKPML